jgi:hypothetical protein
LHLPAAFKAYPGRGTVIYNRVSTREQAGRGKAKLMEKTWLFDDVKRRAPDRRRYAVIDAIETAQLSDPDARPELLRATRYAEERKAIIVVWDWTRLFRPAAYHPKTNRNARPTPEDFRMLHELTRGVRLATVMPPHLTERELHSRATKKTGKAGRPRKLTAEMLAQAVAMMKVMLFPAYVPSRTARYVTSIRKVARHFGVAPSTMRGYLACKLPSGRTGYDELWAEAERLGFVGTYPDGSTYPIGEGPELADALTRLLHEGVTNERGESIYEQLADVFRPPGKKPIDDGADDDEAWDSGEDEAWDSDEEWDDEWR